MKKMLLAVSVCCIQYTQAQTVVTFDDLTLTPNSYWDGSDSTFGFTSGGVYFENSFTPVQLMLRQRVTQTTSLLLQESAGTTARTTRLTTAGESISVLKKY